MLTHLLMILEAAREYLKLTALPSFHPWKARLFFRSSSHCVQPWRLSETLPALLLLFSLFPFTPSDILEPLFDGLCFYLNLAYFSAYLRMFRYVYFYQSVPCCRLRTYRRNALRHTYFCFLSQRNRCRVQKSHVLSVCHSQCRVRDFNCTMNMLALKPTIAPQSQL